MDGDGKLEQRVLDLERALGALASRIAVLEQRGERAEPVRASSPVLAVEPEPPSLPTTERLRGVPAFAGRTCLALGGAFLIRSLTESGTLSGQVGVALGILYAIAWLVLADRAAARGGALSSTFHALTAALIAYPLIVEATTSLQFIGPWPAALLLALATTLGLAIAWRRSRVSIAWITEVGALGSGMLLLLRTREVPLFSFALLALAIASLLLAYARGWRGQRWMVALGLDFVVLYLAVLFERDPRPIWLKMESLLAVELGLVTVYLAAFVLRLLVQARDVTVFAVTQTILVLGAFEGALRIAGTAGRTAIAIGALAVGAVLHAVLARRRESQGQDAAVAYFTTLATFLAAEGVRVLLPPAVYPIVWAFAAILIAVLALPGGRRLFELHAALLAAAAACASGLLAAAVVALAAGAQQRWLPFDATAMVVLVLASVTTALLYWHAGRDAGGPAASTARVLLLTVVLAALGGWLVRGAGAAFAGAPGVEADAGRLAVVRTAVLALAAILLAAAGRTTGAPREVGRLAVCVLLLGGLRLLIEDLRVGHATTLVFSLTIYGLALIVVPALVRRARAPATATARESGD